MWSISKMIANQLFFSGWIFGIRAVEGKIEPMRALEMENGYGSAVTICGSS